MLVATSLTIKDIKNKTKKQKDIENLIGPGITQVILVILVSSST
jgi:hypothetical protein